MSLEARQRYAADTEASHEGGQQDAERYGSRSECQLQHLIPRHFIDQRGTAATGEEDQQHGKVSRHRWCDDTGGVSVSCKWSEGVAYHGPVRRESGNR